MTSVATTTSKDVLDLKHAKIQQRFVEAWTVGQLDKLSRAEQAMFLQAFGQQVGLRAELGELMLYQGKPYITRNGMIRVAHQSGLLGGIVPRPATSLERRQYGATEDEVLWVCDVHRHGAPRPFRGWGCVNVAKDRNPVAKQFPREMAKKRALYDGLRMAFPPDETLGPIHQRYIEEAEQEAAKVHALPMAEPIDDEPEDADMGAVEEDASDFPDEGGALPDPTELPLGDQPKARDAVREGR